MDISTIVGIVLSLGCVVAGILFEGGHLTSFISVSSFLIVIGGSLGAVVIGNSMEDIKRLPSFIISLIMPKPQDWEGTVKTMAELAVAARRDGLLSLESSIAAQKDDFIRSGLRLIVDGSDSEVLDYVLNTRMELIEEDAKRGEKIFEQLGGFCPTLGIVGTVTGLIHVLGNLSQPDKLGASIAIAFIATLYGIAFANLIFLPCANKMKVRNEHAGRFYRMITAGLLAVQAGENPLVTEEKMRSFMHDHGPAAKAAKKAPSGSPATAAA